MSGSAGQSPARLRTNFFDKKGHQYFGFLYGDGKFADLEQDGRLQVGDGFFGVDPEVDSKDSTWAFFYNFDQTLVTNPENPENGWHQTSQAPNSVADSQGTCVFEDQAANVDQPLSICFRICAVTCC